MRHQIKRSFCLWTFWLYMLTAASAAAQSAAPPTIQAQGAILMDGKTGQILYEKNAYQQLAPASTTKIMTAIIAIESGQLDKETTVSKNAANTSGSTMHLQEGQVISLRELLTGLLLRSGNDSAVAIAEMIAGDVESFVGRMNQKAAEIGAANTQFRNPHGLSAPGHKSTAFDLAWITRYAMNNPTFAEIVSTKNINIDWEDSRGNEHAQSLKNTNKLLWMLEEADGVKTGTTKEAGPCLVSSATKNNQRLIAVTLHDTNRWTDSQALLEWGFKHFSLFDYAEFGDPIGSVAVEGGFIGKFSPVLAENAAIVIENGSKNNVQVTVDVPEQINAPVHQGQKIGTLIFSIAGKQLKTFDLVAAEEIEQKTLLRTIFHQLVQLFKRLADLGFF